LNTIERERERRKEVAEGKKRGRKETRKGRVEEQDDEDSRGFDEMKVAAE